MLPYLRVSLVNSLSAAPFCLGSHQSSVDVVKSNYVARSTALLGWTASAVFSDLLALYFRSLLRFFRLLCPILPSALHLPA